MAAQLLDALALFVAFLAGGAHAWVPVRLAVSGSGSERARWARSALPFVLTLALVTLVRARLHPGPFLGAGLLPLGPSPVTTAALVGLGTLILVDLFVALFHAKLEPAGWRVLGAVGGLALVAWSAFEEAARIGSGPAISLADYLTATALRSALALAAGLLVFSRPSPAIARFAGVAAAIATAGLWLLTPTIVRSTLAAGGDPLTLAAGGVLVATSPFVPERFRRLAAVLGFVLLALFLARAGAASDQIGLAGRVPPPLP